MLKFKKGTIKNQFKISLKNEENFETTFEKVMINFKKNGRNSKSFEEDNCERVEECEE